VATAIEAVLQPLASSVEAMPTVLWAVDKSTKKQQSNNPQG